MDGRGDVHPSPAASTGPADRGTVPPHGLAYFRGGETKPEDDPHREIRLSHKPDPPPGTGPVLAWHRENHRGKVSGFFWAFGLLTALAAFSMILDGDPLALFTFWPGWIIILVFSYLMSDPFGYFCYSAGADWVQAQRTRWGITRKHYITLYDLTEIEASYGGPTFHLHLRNAERGFSRSFEELQRDRRIWDLVYNGILYSVANGAKTNNQTAGILQLNETPALRLRRTWEIRNGFRE
ncbi:MAG: hypothetical protein GEU98_05125 [Pseudonocardiaceae bacterium]|nr:hypothetical protein [Pseudonocardiaceae bacterium]